MKAKFDLEDLISLTEVCEQMSDAYRYSHTEEDIHKDFMEIRDAFETIKRVLRRKKANYGNIASECETIESQAEFMSGIARSFNGSNRLTGIPSSKPLDDISSNGSVDDLGIF